MKAMQANKRATGCVGKKRFGSFSLAAKMASRSAHRFGEKFHAYPCACGGFHVGSSIGHGRGVPFDVRQPYIVYARNTEGHVRMMGRAARKDGSPLAAVLMRDGWEIVTVEAAP